MKIIEEVAFDKIHKTLIEGSGTTSVKISDKQRTYICVGCNLTFYSSGMIMHALCDTCWAEFNPWVFEQRTLGHDFSVNDWLAMRRCSGIAD